MSITRLRTIRWYQGWAITLDRTDRRYSNRKIQYSTHYDPIIPRLDLWWCARSSESYLWGNGGQITYRIDAKHHPLHTHEYQKLITYSIENVNKLEPINSSRLQIDSEQLECADQILICKRNIFGEYWQTLSQNRYNRLQSWWSERWRKMRVSGPYRKGREDKLSYGILTWALSQHTIIQGCYHFAGSLTHRRVVSYTFLPNCSSLNQRSLAVLLISLMPGEAIALMLLVTYPWHGAALLYNFEVSI